MASDYLLEFQRLAYGRYLTEAPLSEAEHAKLGGRILNKLHRALGRHKKCDKGMHWNDVSRKCEKAGPSRIGKADSKDAREYHTRAFLAADTGLNDLAKKLKSKGDKANEKENAAHGKFLSKQSDKNSQAAMDKKPDDKDFAVAHNHARESHQMAADFYKGKDPTRAKYHRKMAAHHEKHAPAPALAPAHKMKALTGHSGRQMRAPHKWEDAD